MGLMPVRPPLQQQGLHRQAVQQMGHSAQHEQLGGQAVSVEGLGGQKARGSAGRRSYWRRRMRPGEQMQLRFAVEAGGPCAGRATQLNLMVRTKAVGHGRWVQGSR
jgi:hypothetical protein